MAYQDPYNVGSQAGRYQSNPQYGASDADFNPYANNPQYRPPQRGPSYDNYGGYRDDPYQTAQTFGSPPQRFDSDRTFVTDPMARDDEFGTPPIATKEKFDATVLAAQPREKKTARALRKYRREYQGNLWTKGGGGRCCLRFLCCSIMVAAFLFLSIVLSLALWIRPPNIAVGDVALASTGSPIELSSDASSLTVNLRLNISVNNPNYFDVNFREIKADLTYPLNNTDIGGGSQKDIVFKSNSQTNWTFPFAIVYNRANDPNNQVLVDLASRCGIGGARRQITVDYKITLGLRILVIPISPVVSNSISLDCPIDEDTIRSLLNGAGLGGILSGAGL
ncbi:hypothetical protein ONZ45_g14492 [Pleurotus djamor]|nr:hypothetical protein ONZ45_g14492 [Pleurotus djamor]